MLRFHIVTLFPSYFTSALATGLMGKALEQGILSVDFTDPRSFSTSRHLHVDDRPYGGGPGMVMQVEPVAAALRSLPQPGRILSMAPNGRAAEQSLMRELAKEEDITLLCGRYEGFDARLYDLFPLEPISVGDIVLNGGESAALSLVEAISRLLPGFMGKEESGEDESFSQGLLEYPHFTRPPHFEGYSVPAVLEGGNHKEIAQWRRREALATTLNRRPDLLSTAPLSLEDAKMLAELPSSSCAKNISFCLVHYPILLEGRRVGTSSVTNLDLHDISRLSRTYGFSTFYIATPLVEQRALLGEMLQHWNRSGLHGHDDRVLALQSALPVESIEEARADMERRFGQKVCVIASSANWPGKKDKQALLTCAEIRTLAQQKPVLLLLGTARGLAPEALALCEGLIRPVRFMGYNHLSVRSAAAILADRIVGDFF